MIHMRYTVNGTSQEYTFPDERLDELLARADKQFLPPWTAEDEMRFREIMKGLECLTPK